MPLLNRCGCGTLGCSRWSGSNAQEDLVLCSELKGFTRPACAMSSFAAAAKNASNWASVANRKERLEGSAKIRLVPIPLVCNYHAAAIEGVQRDR